MKINLWKVLHLKQENFKPVFKRMVDLVIRVWPIKEETEVTPPINEILGQSTKKWLPDNFVRINEFFPIMPNSIILNSAKQGLYNDQFFRESHEGVMLYQLSNASVMVTRYYRLIETEKTSSNLSDLYFRNGLYPKSFLMFYPRVANEKYNGYLILGHGNSISNYYHFLHEIFAQVILLLNRNIIKSGDTIYWLSNNLGFQKELGKLLERKYQLNICRIEDYRKYIFSNVKLTTRVTGHSFQFQSLLREVNAAIGADHVDSSSRILLIGRKQKAQRYCPLIQALLNDLCKRLHSRLVHMEDYSVREQKYLFKNAKVIVAQHGASLANLVFCSEETKIFELFQPSYSQLCYASMADTLGLQYYPFVISSRKDIRPCKESILNKISF